MESIQNVNSPEKMMEEFHNYLMFLRKSGVEECDMDSSH